MRQKKVLIIDDEDDFGLLMREYLTKKGCAVIVANSITTGLGLLRAEQPDYLMLDNHLPDGLGWSKAEFILTHYPEVQLILISALDVPRTYSTAFQILSKPIGSAELNKIFSTALPHIY